MTEVLSICTCKYGFKAFKEAIPYDFYISLASQQFYITIINRHGELKHSGTQYSIYLYILWLDIIDYLTVHFGQILRV